MLPILDCDKCDRSIFCCFCPESKFYPEITAPPITNSFDSIDLTTVQSSTSFNLMDVDSLSLDTTYVESPDLAYAANSMTVTLTGSIDLLFDELKTVKLSDDVHMFSPSEDSDSPLQWYDSVSDGPAASFDSQSDHMSKYVPLQSKPNITKIDTTRFNTLQVKWYPSNGSKNLTMVLTFEFKPDIHSNNCT